MKIGDVYLGHFVGRRGTREVGRSATRPRRFVLAVVAGAFLAVSTTGCSSFLEPEPDKSHYFVLSSEGSASVQPGKRTDIWLGLGPVKIPGYLDTQNIVRSDASGSITYVRDAFWAESLGDSFTRALLYRIGRRVGTAHVTQFPWYSSTRVDWKVPVDVLRFEATSDGRVVLVARWTVQRTKDGAVVAGAESVLEEPAGTDPALVVDALSRCVDRLAEAIAAAVVQAAPPARRE
jgi:uncharacterized lipoprotein YmbA